ncbi:class I SAM-dependent methyltransferase [Roseivivax sp. CAU 1753]
MTDTPRNALDVIRSELAPLDGKTLLDIGCGAGGLRAPLQEAGALWRGIDPIPGPPDMPIDTGSAAALPYPENSFDAAICVNALHHVPVAAMGTALDEAARVVRHGGRLVVIEPRADGALSRAMAVVDDETDVRHAAQAAMDRVTTLRQISATDYDRSERYANFDAFCASLIAVDPARAPRIDAAREDLRTAFLNHARHPQDGDAYTLSQPMSVRVFKPV